MMAGQIGYWLLAVGYLHISTFNKKEVALETICTKPTVVPKCDTGLFIGEFG
jgi:hypothetical protein